MPNKLLVLYGSYRSDRLGIRLADFLVRRFTERGFAVELVDAKSIGLPMLDRMYKEHPKGEAPEAMEALADKIRSADAFVFVVGVQMGRPTWVEKLRFISWKTGFGPCRDCQLLGWEAVGARLTALGMQRSVRWGWSLFQYSDVGPITQTLDADASPISASGRHSTGRSPDFPTILHGGRMQPNFTVPACRRLIDARQSVPTRQSSSILRSSGHASDWIARLRSL